MIKATNTFNSTVCFVLCLFNSTLVAQTFPTPPGLTIPAGKSIVITYNVDVNANACPNGTIPSANLSNQSNVTGNFTTVQTDDPDIAGSSNPTLTPFSPLSLGNLVYLDNNRNGIFDMGDQGINGVLLNLYADDGDGMLTVLDGTILATTGTTGGGQYLFTVCPGSYIVEVALPNFNVGGVLYNGGVPVVSSPVGGALDPDNDVNNDDNGDPVGGFGVASQAITLAYGTEPTNDGDADSNTNLSLDFGFKTPTTVTINDMALNEGTGGSTTAFNFTVSRNDNSEAFSLTVNTVAGTAASPSDFAAISGGTVSFTAGGSLTSTVTVLVNHDNVVESHENFTVVLSGAPAGVALSDNTGLGTINNDDTATLTLSGGGALSEGSTFTFNVTLSAPVQGGFSIAYKTEDLTATHTNNDYTDNDGSLSFLGNGGEVKSVTVNSTVDATVELDETFNVLLGFFSGLSLTQETAISISPSSLIGTINNDDSAVVSIAGNVTLIEAFSTQSFSVTLNNPVDVPVTVQFSTANSTASTADNDYTGISGQLVTFPANTTAAQTVSVTINNDIKVEGNESYGVSIGTLNASSRNVSLGTSSRTGTILNDDNSTVTLSGGSSQNEGNTGITNYFFTATLSNPVQGGLTVNYTINDGTATIADNDYTDNDASLVFAGTSGEMHNILVSALGDLNIENDETFSVTINSLSGYPGGVTIAGSPQTGTILNDELDWGDAPDPTFPTLLVSNGARHTLTPGGLHLGSTVDADLDGQPNATASGDGADEDGVTLPTAIVINTTANINISASGPGFLNAWIDYNQNGDWSEMNEQVFTNQAVVAGSNPLNIAIPIGATLGNAMARFRISTASGLSFNGVAADGEVEDYLVTIQNVGISINDVVVTEGNAGTVTASFAVSLNNPAPAGGVTFDIGTQNNTATTANNDYVAKTLTGQTIPAGMSNYTFDVVVNGDLLVEANETFFVNISNVVNAGSADIQGIGTITNDDVATITISNAQIIEGDAGTSNLVFTIMLDKSVDVNVSVDALTTDGSATLAGMDYVLFNQTLTILANSTSQTVSVMINDDCPIEVDETFSLVLSNIASSGRAVLFSGAGSTLAGTGTIEDDDELPEITCPSDNTYNTDPGLCGASVTLVLPTIVSSCGSTSFDFRYRSVDSLDVPTSSYSYFIPSADNPIFLSKNRFEIEWRLTDGSGEIVCNYFIDIIDNENPTITCPGTQTLNLNATCEIMLPDYTSLAITNDNCAVDSVVQSPAPGSTVSLTGNQIITLTVTDESGNTATCSFNVTKIDNTPPVLNCQPSTVYFNGQANLTLVPEDLVSASDSCGINTFTALPATVNISQYGQTISVTVTVTDQSGNSASCVSQVTIAGLPPGWSQNTDGINCPNGNDVDYTPSNQTWAISSTNCNYTTPYNSDELAYAQYSLCGNGEIVAQVTGISGSGWAGISFRETSNAGSKKVQLVTNLSNSARKEIRSTTGGLAQIQQFSTPNRYWLKLVRSGSQFLGYTSTNGVSWILALNASVSMNSCAQVGLILTNNNPSGTVTATFANVSTTGNSLPLVRIPQNSAENVGYEYSVYPNPSNGEINVNLGDYVNKKVRLELTDAYGRLVYEQNLEQASPTESIILNTLPSGIYYLKAKSPGINDNIKKVILLDK